MPTEHIIDDIDICVSFNVTICESKLLEFILHCFAHHFDHINLSNPQGLGLLQLHCINGQWDGKK